jgi:hypothetical protein
MPEGAAIVGLLCALVIGIAVATLIGAVCLRAAIALYNKLAGGVTSPSSVPELTLRKAMWITFSIFLAQMVVGLLIGIFTGPRTPLHGLLESLMGDVAGSAGEKRVDVVVQLFSFPVGLLIMAAVLSVKMPTTFGRACLVTLCYLLIQILIGAVIVLMVLAVIGIFSVAPK